MDKSETFQEDLFQFYRRNLLWRKSIKYHFCFAFYGSTSNKSGKELQTSTRLKMSLRQEPLNWRSVKSNRFPALQKLPQYILLNQIFFNALLLDLTISAIILLTEVVPVWLSGTLSSWSETFGAQGFTLTTGKSCFCKWSQHQLRSLCKLWMTSEGASRQNVIKQMLM